MPPLVSRSSQMPMTTAASSASFDGFGGSTYNNSARINMISPILPTNQPASKPSTSPSTSCFNCPTPGIINLHTYANRVNPSSKLTDSSHLPQPSPLTMPPPSTNSALGSYPSTTSTASSSHTSGSCPQTHSGSDEEQQHTIDERRQKRMISNRESARRSRMRKQQHLDDLRAQIVQLRAENNHILNKFNLASQHYLQIEEENHSLRSHAMDLCHKLQSLHIAMQQAEGSQSIGLDSESLDAIPIPKMEVNSCYMQPSVSHSMRAAELLD
eukprot:Gb_12023 [translate_table: standard]